MPLFFVQIKQIRLVQVIPFFSEERSLYRAGRSCDRIEFASTGPAEAATGQKIAADSPAEATTGQKIAADESAEVTTGQNFISTGPGKAATGSGEAATEQKIAADGSGEVATGPAVLSTGFCRLTKSERAQNSGPKCASKPV